MLQDTYIHTYIHTYVRTYIHTHTHNTYIHTYIHTYVHTYICTYSMQISKVAVTLCVCVFFSQSWKTVCQSWQPFWNTRLWILPALHHHARYRRMYQKDQPIFQWSCTNHLNHQILSGKIYTPCHCRFLWLCCERWISHFCNPCLFPHSVHIVIGPAKSSIGALLNLLECWLVLSVHSFNYVFKLSISWSGVGIILSNMHSNGGGSVCSHNILLLLSFCIISNLWLQGQEGERVCAQACGVCVCFHRTHIMWVR